jgi:hypothetical protein
MFNNLNKNVTTLEKFMNIQQYHISRISQNLKIGTVLRKIRSVRSIRLLRTKWPNLPNLIRSIKFSTQYFIGYFGLGLFGFGLGLFGLGLRSSVFLPTVHFCISSNHHKYASPPYILVSADLERVLQDRLCDTPLVGTSTPLDKSVGICVFLVRSMKLIKQLVKQSKNILCNWASDLFYVTI